MEEVLSYYGFDARQTEYRPYGSGLINDTAIVCSNGQEYIFQRVNDEVFKTPFAIAENIDLIEDYLQRQSNGYIFTGPLKTTEGRSMVYIAGKGYYRAFPFVAGSHTIDVVQTPGQAYEAARQFGAFTKKLAGLDVRRLHITLPGFHDLSFRYTQFLQALNAGNQQRIQEAATLIGYLKEQVHIARQFDQLRLNDQFKIRVTHHDTKISNVLFDEQDKGICVIDLDTVMPGYFISDVGDMMRTYLCPVSEEEQDFDKIEVREDFYQAIVAGYGEYMGSELTVVEQNHFFYSGKFMIYMQALRFLTDHINDDIYYGARYEGHNLVRAQNQAILLQRLTEQESVWITSISSVKL
ncbi:phosphotransferase enzyme family protein [Niabella terrae]